MISFIMVSDWFRHLPILLLIIIQFVPLAVLITTSNRTALRRSWERNNALDDFVRRLEQDGSP